MSQIGLSPGAIATLACMLEVSAPKPGNVHRGADFEDVTFVDFATSAVVLGDSIESGTDDRVGQTILDAVRQTRTAVGTNTNLGMILLLVPLAKIAAINPGQLITSVLVSDYLNNLALDDGRDVFEAIRLANPGGIGKSESLDVSTNDDPVCLIEAMQVASERDAVARQYVSGFETAIEFANIIERGRNTFENLSQVIVAAHVTLMGREPDSLIARKCGRETAEHSQMLANKALEFLSHDGTSDDRQVGRKSFWKSVGELDFWLRSDGHRRNPGTTADLIAASLFVGIHNGNIKNPFR